MNSISNNIDPVGLETLDFISEAAVLNEWMYNDIKPYLRGQVLEIGSGIGNISSFALKDFPVTLSDFNNDYVTLLTKKFSNHPNLQGILSIDLQSPDFEKKFQTHREKYDSIFLLNVIEHIKDDTAAIANCKYLLKKGGVLVILAPAYPLLYCNLDKNLGHYRRYTQASFKHLALQNNLCPVALKYFNFIGIGGWFFWGVLLKRRVLTKTVLTVFNKLAPLFKIIDRFVFRKIGLSLILVAQK